VQSRTLTKFAATNPLWAALEITNKGRPIPPKYHHLMIDSESLGTDNWEKIIKNITIHFAL
jgi:hypothetical protein